jgi:hypothetical protein
MTSVAHTLVVLASEAGEHQESAGSTPYLVGGLALVTLLALLAMLIFFGGGREHS